MQIRVVAFTISTTYVAYFMSYYTALMPTAMAFGASGLYCTLTGTPVYRANTTKPFVRKVAANVQNVCVGVATALAFYSPEVVVPAGEMRLAEEVFRAVGYSVLIEFAFYWTHRMMHASKFLYMYVHREHHLEADPSPIDAYILTVPESISVVFSFTFPNFIGYVITRRAMIAVQTIHLVFGILVHGGLPCVQHHMLHHKYLRGNYSGIYPLWDVVFGTRIENNTIV